MSRVLLVAILLIGTIGGACADDDHEQVRRWVEEGRVVPLAQILDAARSRYSGRLLEAELKRKGDGYYYHLEIVDDAGLVWELKYDAVSGQLLDAEKDD